MNEEALQGQFLDFINKVKSNEGEAALSNEFNEIFAKVQEAHLIDNFLPLIQLSSSLENEEQANLFFNICFSCLNEYLTQNVQERLDFYVEAVSISLETKYRIVFVLSFSSLMKKFFIDQNPVDLNLFLAFQSPIYAYSISKKEQSKDIFYTWFEPLAASLGCDIFKTDYDLAVSYFKLMNHAFFQFSITNMQEIKQDPFLVEAQKLMKNAIVTLSNKLYSK